MKICVRLKRSEMQVVLKFGITFISLPKKGKRKQERRGKKMHNVVYQRKSKFHCKKVERKIRILIKKMLQNLIRLWI